MSVIEIINASATGVGIIGGVILYFKHDNKLKDQERRINEFNIERIEKEKELEKQADIDCNILYDGGGLATIKFYNSGKCDARNVRMNILSRDDGVIVDPWGPYKVLGKSGIYSREERIALLEGHDDTMDIEVTWDDDYAINRSKILHPPFSK